ncbi:MAG: SDR family oxidoreductase [Rhodococcus sp. (in: high G+C Gram-positive bacteria)]|uniref:SDR family NAD(P)-dependent oxidoreductase n=1 Tax=Rhodococcus sp. TaxID=1831 RepID=UPI003BB73A97
MVNELSGKVAVVTGGASGIGRAIVERYIAEGARVVVADVEREHAENLVRSCGPMSVFRYTDVGDVDQVAAMVDFAVESFGGLDVMCNNAGIPGKMHKSFLQDDLADFGKVMAVNLLGVMAGTRYAAAYMADHGGGSIVNMSSIGGVQAGGGVMTYRASKAAIIQFTKSAAIELEQYDIRVNCIAPGSIPTALLATSMTAMADERSDRLTRAVRASMQTDRPLERDGTPEDVAEAALYFAGDRARYLTGTVLPVDGGTTAGKPLRRKSAPVESAGAPMS